MSCSTYLEAFSTGRCIIQPQNTNNVIFSFPQPPVLAARISIYIYTLSLSPKTDADGSRRRESIAAYLCRILDCSLMMDAFHTFSYSLYTQGYCNNL